MTCVIRGYRPEDAARLESIWRDTFADTWPLPDGALAQLLTQHEQLHPGCTRVAGEYEPLGVIVYQRSASTPSLGAIVLVLVDPSHRRRGIATELLRTALHHLRTVGGERVELGSWAYPQLWHGVPLQGSAGAAFFRARGWQLDGRNADVVVDLTADPPLQPLIARASDAGVHLRFACDSDRSRILEFVTSEHDRFAPYFAEIFRSGAAGHVCVAETGDRVDGAIIRSYFPACPGAQWQRLLGEDMCAMGALVVGRDVRRRGIGLGVCAYVLDAFRNEGFRNCYLEWATLIHMYEQLGGVVWRKYVQGVKRL
jgi:ribosomal protein S18 acetylase RimI-like enzyme